mmetsp:Transcript_11286/g.31769  ORF Transcript_11286/g.31769 Transcript_11286/m.31769 type:complete len:244 (-) Transcript_11286:114-845(-)
MGVQPDPHPGPLRPGSDAAAGAVDERSACFHEWREPASQGVPASCDHPLVRPVAGHRGVQDEAGHRAWVQHGQVQRAEGPNGAPHDDERAGVRPLQPVLLEDGRHRAKEGVGVPPHVRERGLAARPPIAAVVNEEDVSDARVHDIAVGRWPVDAPVHVRREGRALVVAAKPQEHGRWRVGPERRLGRGEAHVAYLDIILSHEHAVRDVNSSCLLVLETLSRGSGGMEGPGSVLGSREVAHKLC